MKKEHIEQMESIQNGATIWGYKNALLLREVQVYDSELITIIDDLEELERIENKVYDGTGRLPYFGAILTEKGKSFINDFNSECGQSGLNVRSEYIGYSDKECINCGRLRVEKWKNGDEICEKCNFNQKTNEFDIGDLR